MTSIPVHAVGDDAPVSRPGRLRRLARVVWRRRVAPWVAAAGLLLVMVSAMSFEHVSTPGHAVVLTLLLGVGVLGARAGFRAMPGGTRAALFQGRGPWL